VTVRKAINLVIPRRIWVGENYLTMMKVLAQVNLIQEIMYRPKMYAGKVRNIMNLFSAWNKIN